MRVDLLSLLMEHSEVKSDVVKETTIKDCVLSFLQLRDKLYLLGNIMYEDKDNQVYIASVRAGLADMNYAVIAMQLQGKTLRIAGYAKEGLISQKAYEKAICKIQDAALGKKVTGSAGISKVVPIILAVITLTVFIMVRGCVFDGLSPNTNWNPLPGDGQQESTEDPAFVKEVELTIEATKAYNEAVAQFNLRVEEFNEAVALVCVDNIKGVPSVLETLSQESESYEDNAEVVRGDNNKEKIAVDTELVRDMTKQVEMLTAVVKQITSPTDDWIMDRLVQVSGITGVQEVTEQMDPDDLLGKDGGFSACVYFTHVSIDSETVPGDSIVEKGTDAGGAVEVYATREDAEARCEYLAEFDGTILYSGSYAIVGTMVIRTSYKLTDEQQFDLTNAITMALTTLAE